MPIEVLECPACNGDLEFATKEPFRCPYCRKLLRLIDEIKNEKETGNQTLEIVDEESITKAIDSVAFEESEDEEWYDPEPKYFTYFSASFILFVVVAALSSLFGNSTFSIWSSTASYLYFVIIAFYGMTKFNDETNTIRVEGSSTTAFAVLTCLGINLYLAFTNYHQFNSQLLNIIFGVFAQLVAMTLSLVAGIILYISIYYSQKPLSTPR